VRLELLRSAFRWFFLIVLYGVFIPNTWQRCALVVGAIGLIPLALAAVGAWRCGPLDPSFVSALIDVALLLLTGMAVSVFGSYRIHVLEEKAFEAQQLGQYRLKQRLGSGGMGEVYLAEHLLLRRPCALKLIRPDQSGDPTNLRRFEREVRAMATLTHWNTVEVYDYGHAEDGTFYYVMEYLPGLNLEALVSRHGPLPAGRALHFLRQVCRALREAHGIGLLHRDIKPSNVIACERGGVYDVAKLLDFGLVQGTGLGPNANRLTVQGSIVGSPPYMSPEQAAGKDPLDARSDVYSVGSVAYYLLTGQPPFVRDTGMATLLAHAYEEVVPPSQVRPDVPAEVEAVVLRCLRKDPALRYPDADSLEKALAACAAALPWTEDQAAAWWREHAAEGSGETDPPSQLKTQLSAR
jgi:serine/threonine-protein kinase